MTEADGKTATAAGGSGDRSRVERALALFTQIRSGEGRSALALLASVFLILTAYYLIKPAREGWLSISVIRGLSKIEVKAYSSFGQTLLLFGAVHVYSRIVARWPRRTLVTVVGIFFLSNLPLFWLLQPGLLMDTVPFAGVAFYLWVGIFNVFIVAQFWSFTADFYDSDQGKRLIPLIAVGAAGGAVFGSWLSERVVATGRFEAYDLILLAVLPLLLSILSTRRADAWGPAGSGSPSAARQEPPLADEGLGGLALVRRHRYLLATAGLTLLFGWAGSNGENVLFGVVQEVVEAQAGELGISAPAALEAYVREQTTAFYGNYFFWVNLCGLLLQAFLVSRLLRYGGFGLVLMLLPLVTVFGYTAMALVPMLSLIKVMKIAENSTNYSINNTARHVLWLPTTAEMKYKAKQAIDTLCVRFGDGLAALTVLIGVQAIGLAPVSLLWLNVAIGIAWLGVATIIVREHRRMTASKGSSARAD